jgi:hypothetical protein
MIMTQFGVCKNKLTERKYGNLKKSNLTFVSILLSFISKMSYQFSLVCSITSSAFLPPRYLSIM